MRKYAISVFLFFISCTISISGSVAANTAAWKLTSSLDGFWIKSTSKNQHELLLAYHNKQPQFLLILKTDSPSPDKAIPIKIQIDKGPRERSKLSLLEKRSEQSIFRIEINDEQKNNMIPRMIAGLNWKIYFNSEKNADHIISFSLKGFTAAFNDLLVADKIGSLDTNWLINHKKDRELYCLLTTNISIQAMQYRAEGRSYADTLHLIPQTHYSIVDNHLAEIITQVYDIPLTSLPCEPRAEKYLMFSRCIQQPLQQRRQE